MTEKIIPVNAYWIRQTLDTDFAIFHRHAYPGNEDYSLKDYIPEGERWVNHLNIDELSFLLEVEKEFEGLVKEAYNQKRLEIIEQLKPNRIPISELITEQWVTPEGLLIVIVDDRKVRRYYDPEFVQGGHGYVYSYIPKSPKQVWIAASMDRRDRLPTINHEGNERNYMAKGLDYEPAHEEATRLEKSYRVAHGGSYASLETPLGFSQQQLLALYLDLNK